jgi:hypothetical protein
MGTSIERHQPQQGRALAIYDRPLAKITPALRFGTQLQNREREFGFYFGHGKDMVRHIGECRAKLLPLFAQANAARLSLVEAIRKQVDHKLASAMVGQLLAGFAAKPDPAVLAAMVDMLQGDELAIASELWQPLHVSPAALALACRKLIATATFVPKAAELHAACRDAANHLRWAYEAADKLIDFLRRCDVLLLEFDHDEWERPYLTPEYRPILQRMLDLHSIYGDGSDAFGDWDYDDDGKPTHPLVALIIAEHAKIGIEWPRVMRLEPPPEPVRIAAASKRGHVKRSRKPRSEKPQASSEQEPGAP